MSNYMHEYRCGCKGYTWDGGAQGPPDNFELKCCPLHDTAKEMLALLKDLARAGEAAGFRLRIASTIDKAEAK